jgi:hypothetical protein
MSHVAAAAWKGDLPRVRALLDEGCPVDRGACELAASKGHVETLEALLDEGVPAGNAVAYAVKAGSVGCLDALYERGNAISKVAVEWSMEDGIDPVVMTWVHERVIAPRAWAVSLQRILDEHKTDMKEQAYIEISNLTMRCHRLCTPDHSC